MLPTIAKCYRRPIGLSECAECVRSVVRNPTQPRPTRSEFFLIAFAVYLDQGCEMMKLDQTFAVSTRGRLCGDQRWLGMQSDHIPMVKPYVFEWLTILLAK